jgi:hypothetical protein
MRQAEQIRLLEGLMRHLDEGANVDAGCQVRNPVSSYLSQERATREWAEFFQGEGDLDVDSLLGDLGPELESWKIERFVFRMTLCMKSIDDLRGKPKETWNVLHGSVPVYYLFPNVQLIMSAAGPTLVRVYPDGANPHQSFSQIGFYLNPHALESEVAKRFAAQRGVSVEQLFASRMEDFARVIQSEDYVAAASGHRGAAGGAQDYVLFGRNEPALHHYHNTYRDALGMEPLAQL